MSNERGEAHTPAPWRLHANFETRICAGPTNPLGVDVANTRNGTREPDIAECIANAAFIVRAANSHDALVKALEDAGRWIEGQPSRATCKATTLHEMLANIEDALNLARKEP